MYASCTEKKTLLEHGIMFGHSLKSCCLCFLLGICEATQNKMLYYSTALLQTRASARTWTVLLFYASPQEINPCLKVPPPFWKYLCAVAGHKQRAQQANRVWQCFPNRHRSVWTILLICLLQHPQTVCDSTSPEEHVAERASGASVCDSRVQMERPGHSTQINILYLYTQKLHLCPEHIWKWMCSVFNEPFLSFMAVHSLDNSL